ncbi:class I SAM-dependent methyltransferase [Alteromonas gracilis]
MTTPHPQSSGFGARSDAYDRGRPGYPRDLLAWAVGSEPRVVLELGAGTGRCTAELVGLGHDVHATDPDGRMLARLAQRLPDVRTSVASAEEIPLPDRSVDVVVCAQSFHWFDHDRAVPEIARVLRRGGQLVLLWNGRDAGIPWVRRFERIVHRGETPTTPDAVEVLGRFGEFGFVEDRHARHWHDVDRTAMMDLVSSLSYVSARSESEQARVLAEVQELWDGLDRLTLRMPYVCDAFRATVRHIEPDPPVDPPSEGPGDADDGGEDTGTLLIDFR